MATTVQVSDKTRKLLQELKEQESFSTVDATIRYLISEYEKRKSVVEAGASVLEDLFGKPRWMEEVQEQ